MKDETMEMKEQQPAPEESLHDEASAVLQEEESIAEGNDTEADVTPETAEPVLEELKEQLAQQRQQAEEHLDHLQRLQAEFSNYRRRMAQEKLQAASRGKEEVFLALLPILSNLRLALQHADQDANAVRQGVQMIWQQCEDFLRSQGVEPIETVGQPFDPAKHEALSTAPATEETPPDTVVAEISAGYTMNDHLLRPAQVVVAKAEDPASVSEPEPEEDTSPAPEAEA